jgi:hypothetical protein
MPRWLPNRRQPTAARGKRARRRHAGCRDEAIDCRFAAAAVTFSFFFAAIADAIFRHIIDYSMPSIFDFHFRRSMPPSSSFRFFGDIFHFFTTPLIFAIDARYALPMRTRAAPLAHAPARRYAPLIFRFSDIHFHFLRFFDIFFDVIFDASAAIFILLRRSAPLARRDASARTARYAYARAASPQRGSAKRARKCRYVCRLMLLAAD